MSSQESDFADDIVADHLPTHSEPPRDEFMPWHRVRKEYIRRHQWNELAIRLVEGCWRKQLQQAESEWSLEEAVEGPQLEIPEGVALDKSLNCLVIPGDDLLDVRALGAIFLHTNASSDILDSTRVTVRKIKAPESTLPIMQ